MTLAEAWKYGLGLHKVIRISHPTEEDTPLTATSLHDHNTRINNLRKDGLSTAQIMLSNNYEVLLS